MSDEQSLATGRITGVGGVFFKSPDPEGLSAWYRDVLGVGSGDWPGAALPYDAPGHPPFVIWSPFKETTDYFKPSSRDFMINFAVDDLGAFLDRLAARSVSIIGQDDSDPNGRFAWIMDPDGNKIELWEPKQG